MRRIKKIILIITSPVWIIGIIIISGIFMLIPLTFYDMIGIDIIPEESLDPRCGSFVYKNGTIHPIETGKRLNFTAINNGDLLYFSCEDRGGPWIIALPVALFYMIPVILTSFIWNRIKHWRIKK